MLFSQQLYQIFKLVAIIRVSICFLIKKIPFFQKQRNETACFSITRCCHVNRDHGEGWT